MASVDKKIQYKGRVILDNGGVVDVYLFRAKPIGFKRNWSGALVPKYQFVQFKIILS